MVFIEYINLYSIKVRIIKKEKNNGKHKENF